LIINGDGPAATVYFDNIRIEPVVPEPTSAALVAVAIPGFLMAVRRRERVL
jgi:hypothetical protein